MDDLISRQEVIDALDAVCDRECEYSKQQRSFMCGACRLGSAFDVIDELPSAQPEYTEQDMREQFNAGCACGMHAAQPEHTETHSCDYQRTETHDWIPVTERLPEEGVAVLTQAQFRYDVKFAVSARIDFNYWTGWGTRDINITAWMPIPEPYKAESEDKK